MTPTPTQTMHARTRTHAHTHTHTRVQGPPSLPQEIDELLGQNLTEEDEDAIAEELESLILVSEGVLGTHPELP